MAEVKPTEGRVTERWIAYDTGFQSGKIQIARGQVKTDEKDDNGRDIYEVDYTKRGSVRIFTNNVNNAVKKEKEKQFSIQMSIAAVMEIVKNYNENNGFKEMLDDLYAKEMISELYSMKDKGCSVNTIKAAATDYGISDDVVKKIIGA